MNTKESTSTKESMSTNQNVARDERTVAIENASYRWTCILLSFALLVDVGYRGLVRQEAAWDLMALVIVSGAVSTVYQARQKVLGHGWVKTAALVVCLGAVIGFIVVVAMIMILRRR